MGSNYWEQYRVKNFDVMHASAVVRCRVTRIVKNAVTVRTLIVFPSKKQLLIHRTEYQTFSDSSWVGQSIDPGFQTPVLCPGNSLLIPC